MKQSKLDKLISDIEKYQFIKSMIGCGISMISKGYAEGLNKPTLYIIYLDASNLYEYSMMELSPLEIFELVNPKKYCCDDGPIVCFLKVDLSYPDEHNLHKDYPLATTKNKSNKKNAV